MENVCFARIFICTVAEQGVWFRGICEEFKKGEHP
jgi:hypothetical protein